MVLRGNFDSDVLHTHAGISVIVPEHSGAPHKVVYLLHGLHGNQDQWLDNTAMIENLKDEDIVFVCPGVGRSFYTDMKYGHEYFRFVSQELPEICRNSFGITTKREDTAVIGCSMGAYGALKLALSSPEAYGYCAAISPAPIFSNSSLDICRKAPEAVVKTQGEEIYQIWKDLKLVFGEKFEVKKADEILHLAAQADKAAQKPQLYLCCGTEDPFCKPTAAFVEEMRRDYHYDLEWETWSGAHEWRLFETALYKALANWK
jgi:S-formylglutathione hydrolase FrmB